MQIVVGGTDGADVAGNAGADLGIAANNLRRCALGGDNDSNALCCRTRY
jgi:hypothetical protein